MAAKTEWPRVPSLLRAIVTESGYPALQSLYQCKPETCREGHTKPAQHSATILMLSIRSEDDRTGAKTVLARLHKIVSEVDIKTYGGSSEAVKAAEAKAAAAEAARKAAEAELASLEERLAALESGQRVKATRDAVNGQPAAKGSKSRSSDALAELG